MIDLSGLEAGFVTGSQHLYCEKTLIAVAQHSREIANAFTNSTSIPVKVIASR